VPFGELYPGSGGDCVFLYLIYIFFDVLVIVGGQKIKEIFVGCGNERHYRLIQWLCNGG
jgi:hypothetical protein